MTMRLLQRSGRPRDMTLRQWCRLTGWPYEELLNTGYQQMLEIWGHMDLTLMMGDIRIYPPELPGA